MSFWKFWFAVVRLGTWRQHFYGLIWFSLGNFPRWIFRSNSRTRFRTISLVFFHFPGKKPDKTDSFDEIRFFCTACQAGWFKGVSRDDSLKCSPQMIQHLQDGHSYKNGWSKSSRLLLHRRKEEVKNLTFAHFDHARDDPWEFPDMSPNGCLPSLSKCIPNFMIFLAWKKHTKHKLKIVMSSGVITSIGIIGTELSQLNDTADDWFFNCLVPWRKKNVHDIVVVFFSFRLEVYHFRLANVHLFVTFSEEITWIRDWQLSRTFGIFGIALSVSSETGFPLFGLT